MEEPFPGGAVFETQAIQVDGISTEIGDVARKNGRNLRRGKSHDNESSK